MPLQLHLPLSRTRRTCCSCTCLQSKAMPHLPLSLRLLLSTAQQKK
jgi:hypothetical protein